MLIAGINDGHNGSVVLLQDGVIVFAWQEERFTRRKNQPGFPVNALRVGLASIGADPDQVDVFAIASTRPTSIPRTCDEDVLSYPRRDGFLVRRLCSRLRGTPLVRPFYHGRQRRRLRRIAELGIPVQKIRFYDHHLCHAATAFWGSGRSRERSLILTSDGAGDGLCGSVYVGDNGTLRRLAALPEADSIGMLYTTATVLLGMLPNEHEYKVTGLAPYGAGRQADDLKRDLLAWVSVDGPADVRADRLGAIVLQLLPQAGRTLRVQTIRPHRRRRPGVHRTRAGLLGRELCANDRDSSRDALGRRVPQRQSELQNPGSALRAEPVRRAVVRRRDERIRCGVSGALGNVGTDVRRAWLALLRPGHRQCGRGAGDRGIGRRRRAAGVDAAGHHTGGRRAAEPGTHCGAGLRPGGIRGPGSRKPLDPSIPGVVQTINAAIKRRDFWMPFACSILAEEESRYIRNPKGMPAPYMVMTFDCTLQWRTIVAGIHPRDHTVWPQIVRREANPEYHRLLSAFRDLTGRGALLNTSYNLHGEPLVSSAGDALDVFKRSDLRWLALADKLVTKP